MKASVTAKRPAKVPRASGVQPSTPEKNRAFIDALAGLGRDCVYEKGTVIVSEGARGGSLFVIRSGRVQVYASTSGERKVLIDEHGPGDYFGEMSLDGNVRSASVCALERSLISVVEREPALAFIERNPAWSLALIFELTGRLRLATDNFKNLALFDVYGRVARVLQSLAETSTDRRHISAMPTQAELAQRVGASREMVGLILRDLRVGGYIVMRGREMTIEKPLPERW